MQKASSVFMNLGAGELRSTSLAGSSEETHKKHSNSKAGAEEPEQWLLRADAGTSTLYPFFPVSWSVDWSPEMVNW